MRVWDSSSLEPAKPLASAANPVQAMASTPDGMRVFGLHASGILTCWRVMPAVATPDETCTFQPERLELPEAFRQGAMRTVQLAWLGGKSGSLAGRYPCQSCWSGPTHLQMMCLCAHGAPAFQTAKFLM